MYPRRALLFTPGNDRHKIEKAASLGVDSVVVDLEDGVAYNRKNEAREVVADALQTVDFGETERLVRMNPPMGRQYVHDIEATAQHCPDGYILPKVETAQQIKDVCARLDRVEAKHNWPQATIRLLALIETARAVVNLREIAESDPRLVALVFGAEDLAGDMGATRTPDGWEVFYARSAVVLHAKAQGLQAIDTPYLHLENMVGLEAETEQALYMGFTGKLAIHPRQIAPIERIFTPTSEDIAQAHAIIAENEAHQDAGEGFFVLDGKIMDAPNVRAAEIVLARARAAGVAIN